MRNNRHCTFMLRGLALALGLAFSLPAFAVPALAGYTEMAGTLDAVLSQAVDRGQVAGAVVMVAHDGQVVYHKSFGSSDRESGAPMRTDTVFRLASMTKPIVSAAALALADQGQLSLDDPVTRWLPEFSPRLPDGKPTAITVRHLLTHTSGLGYGFLEPKDGPLHRAGVSDGLDRPGISQEENLRRLALVPLAFAPGSGWKYSLSIDVLGAVVARAGGGTLPDVVARLITGPLAMKDTVFVAPAPERLATPYVHGPQPLHRMADPEDMPHGASAVRFQPSRATDPEAFPSGGGGLCGTAADYLAFLEAVRQGGGAILKSATAQAMTANQIGEIAPDLAGPGWGFGFGAAVLLDPAKAQYPGRQGTWSWGGVYGASFFMDRASGLSAVVLTNTTPDGMDGAFPLEVARAVYGK